MQWIFFNEKEFQIIFKLSGPSINKPQKVRVSPSKKILISSFIQNILTGLKSCQKLQHFANHSMADSWHI